MSAIDFGHIWGIMVITFMGGVTAGGILVSIIFSNSLNKKCELQQAKECDCECVCEECV